MDHYSYAPSYPESGDSSPRSREIDFDNTPPWEEQTASGAYKVKFMCSYGGKIHPRPHDNQLSYIGGETKILAVDRSTKFAGLVAKLSALCDADVCFKYQLPGEDLDALISVTNDDDLEHMMHEYDRLYRASSKPARMRLFLFPANQAAGSAEEERFSSGEGKSDKERFVDALNSGPIQAPPPPSTAAPPNNVDFLFGLEKGIHPPLPPPPQVVTKLQDPVPDPEIPDRVIGPDPIQNQIQDFQRLQIGGQEQDIYRRRSDDNLVGGFPGDYYAQKIPEKLPPATLPGSAPPGYWPEKQVGGGGYPAPPEHPVYMVPAPASMYHSPMVRPMTGPAGLGYYAVQRMPREVYRDPTSVYNVMPPSTAVTAMSQPSLPPQNVTGFPEGLGMVRPTSAGGMGVMDTGYPTMAYDNVAGRQMYYTAQGGVVSPPPPPYQAMSAAVSGDMRPSVAFHQEGKVVVKTSQSSV
ncbi:octicosapeptide/Phox/Bem1p family protein [Actinidia rufa]|uniref:Octicosapeptide/Phox/Bem1p family protein n=1 Tax=Actinidia rufa TaxID=165716 RepID=A0A7J0DG45_9ERIC|nr:octicosapeptide/Phox/Bem1p family protein [Actinidia rufa]